MGKKLFYFDRANVFVFSCTNFFLQVKNNLLNNQKVSDDKLTSHQHQPPLKKIVNNLANQDNNNGCNKCKESKATSCNNNNCSEGKPSKGFINLAFVDATTEAAAWYQPHLPRNLAASILADCPVGSFVVRTSQTAERPGSLALTLRVPRSFNGTGILHYLILATDAGFRIKGFSKVFPSLSGLVVHHSVMKENLPCLLLMHDGEDTEEEDSDKEADFADLDSDPEYPGLLSRLRQQFASE